MANTQFVNFANTIVVGITRSEVAAPNSAFGQLLTAAGVQTTPQTARGYMPGSITDYMNNNLVHVCDFKFLSSTVFSVNDLNQIISGIGSAIPNAKNQAAAMLRTTLSKAIDAFRTAITAISTALNFDATGSLALNFAIAQNTLADIKDLADKIQQTLQDVLTYVFLLQDIQQLLTWILGLPAKIQALLKGCVQNFTNSLTQVTNNIKSLPNTVLGTSTQAINSVANQVNATTQLVLNSVSTNYSKYSSTLPAALVNAISAPSSANPNAISAAINLNNSTAMMSLPANTQSQKANTSGP